MKVTSVFLLLALPSCQSRSWILVRAWLTFCTAIHFKLSIVILCIYGCTQPSQCAWAAQSRWEGCWESPQHRRHPKQARETQLMPTLSWEHPSPLQWIHREHQTLSHRGIYLEPPINSDWMQIPVRKQAHWSIEWSLQGCKPISTEDVKWREGSWECWWLLFGSQNPSLPLKEVGIGSIQSTQDLTFPKIKVSPCVYILNQVWL